MATDKGLEVRARHYVEEVWDDVVADIDYLVQVESVEDKEHADVNMPFGPGPREALDRALIIARRLGLETHDCEGFIGYADLAGEREDYLATIAHSDIVPLGTGWTVDPLHVTRKEGYLMGRGVLDDKGPLVLSLYAAHFFARQVKETGERLPYTLRCLVGTNEETGMEDVDYYLNRYPEPLFCFTPDAVYPLICGEKGIFRADIMSGPMGDGDARIVSLEGGTVSNAIPGHAEAIVRARAASLPAEEGIQVEACGTKRGDGELARVTATGKGGHASMPEGTRNAIGMLTSYLLQNDLCNAEERTFLEFERVVHADTAGQALGIAATDDLFEPLTCIGGTIRTIRKDGAVRFVQTIDCRYPKSTTGEAIARTVGEVAGRHACSIVDKQDMAPFYVTPDSPEIKALVETYNEVAHKDARAFTIGGGTYARHFKRAAAFGPDDPSEPSPDWVGIEHGPDEGFSEELLKRALLIYVLSIARLMELSYEVA